MNASSKVIEFHRNRHTGIMPMPTKFKLCAGAAEGKTKLTAFDNALVAADIANVNLVRVTSILPPLCDYDPEFVLPPGALVPTAYGSMVSDVKGELIASAIAVGIDNRNTFGMIMEYSAMCSQKEAEQVITGMLEESFSVRSKPLNAVKIKAVEHQVQQIGCTFACAPLWFDQ